MESLGINLGYLVMQLCIFFVPLIGLGLVFYYLGSKGMLHGTETVTTIPVTDEGVVIPTQLLKGAKKVTIKRKGDTLFLVLIKSKPMD